MIFLAVALQAATATVASPAPQAPDVVVTGKRPADLKAALDECLARRCPAKEDIAKSIAYAESQFVDGDYAGSRHTLVQARGRNARYASAIPVEVSEMHRATGTMFGLTGLDDSEAFSFYNVVAALKAGLPPGDARIVSARLEICDTETRQRKINDALACYNRVIKQARRLSLRTVEGIGMFRKAALLSAIAHSRYEYGASARDAVRDILATTDPDMAPFRNGARLIDVVLIDNPKKRKVAMDAALARMDPTPPDTPILIYSPPVDTNAAQLETGDDRVRWVDVAFAVGADGLVEAAHVLRRSDNLADRWTKPITAMVANRRYMPMRLASGTTTVNRVERFTFVSDLVYNTGTHIMVRSARPRLVSTDLTPPAAGLELRHRLARQITHSVRVA